MKMLTADGYDVQFGVNVLGTRLSLMSISLLTPC